MRMRNGYLAGSVLPTVIAACVVLLTAVLGLLALWERETLAFVRGQRIRQARADVESAFLLYRFHADLPALTAPEGYRLYDSLPQSRVFVRTEPWGLYDLVRVMTADSVLGACRLFGGGHDVCETLYCADDRSALTLAGRSVLQGVLRLPRKGLTYGRVGSDLFSGPEVPRMAVKSSQSGPLPCAALAVRRVAALFRAGGDAFPELRSDSVVHPFRNDSAAVFRLGDAELGAAVLRGKILLFAGELRIDSACRMEHALVCARRITVGSGARIAAQLFALDTVEVEPRAVLEYPSGIYAQRYVAIGERASVDGYVVVRDTVLRRKTVAAYRQSRTARVRGLLWVEGAAQVQGIVAGRAVLRQAVYFSPQGYYQDVLYDATLLQNPLTVQPFWEPHAGRKEAACVD